MTIDRLTNGQLDSMKCDRCSCEIAPGETYSEVDSERLCDGCTDEEERMCRHVYPATWGYSGGTPPEMCGEIDCKIHPQGETDRFEDEGDEG